MKRSFYVGAFVLATIALVAVLATGAIPLDAGQGFLIAMAAAPGIVTPEDVGAITKQLGNIEQQMKAAADEVKKNGETLQTEVKNLGEATADTKKNVDDAIMKFNDLATGHRELAGRVNEIAQTLAQRRQDNEPRQIKSPGELFTESEQFKSFKGGKGAIRVPMSRKDITNVVGTVGSNTSPANSLVGSQRLPEIVGLPQQTLTIRDLLAPGQTDQGMVEYVQVTGFTNNASVVTEGSTKPKSELTFELKTAPVRTIAHIFKASRTILDDAPQLRSLIDAEARYGLKLTEEDEILNGDGSGAHIRGIIPQATAFNAAFVPASRQRIDTIRLAILQVFIAKYPANGIVLHPTDWAEIQLIKDSQARYIIGNPQDGNTPRLWNLPVVESLSMDVTEFLVGAFNMGAQIFDRMDVEILLSTENSDDFERNMVTLRAEERLALTVKRPEAFVTGDFDTAT
jgi:HK97 family phage major capsid protein